MDIERLLHDVNLFLTEIKCDSREKQEYYIAGHFSNDAIVALEKVMEQYGKDYTCDFRELQRMVYEDLESTLFEIQ